MSFSGPERHSTQATTPSNQRTGRAKIGFFEGGGRDEGESYISRAKRAIRPASGPAARAHSMCPSFFTPASCGV